MNKIFVSYSSNDRSEIKKIVDDFTDKGIRVWWDQEIRENSWSDEIEKHLGASKKVIVFLTKSVISSKIGYILLEMKIAMSAKKLIPVIIGDFDLPYAYQAITISLQSYHFKDFDSIKHDPKYLQLCELCLNKVPIIEMSSDVQSLEKWIESCSDIKDIYLALSIAFLEGSEYLKIDAANKNFMAIYTAERRSYIKSNFDIIDNQDNNSKNTNSDASDEVFFATKSKKLRKVLASVFKEQSRHGLEIENVRFNDSEWGQLLISYVWDEMDLLRPIIIQWSNVIMEYSDIDTKTKLALKIGILARSRFSVVYQDFIQPWILSENQLFREAADIVLAVAIMDEKIKTSATSIVKSFSESSDQSKLRAAIELACGYTGSGIDNLSISILKQIAERKSISFNIFHTMESSISFLMNSLKNAEDNSLLNLNKLLSDLSDWVTSSKIIEKNLLPLALFLNIAENLPIFVDQKTFDSLSIHDLLKEHCMRFAVAKVFACALCEKGNDFFSPRETTRHILKLWISYCIDNKRVYEESMRINFKQNMGELVKNIFDQYETDRDKERIKFIARRLSN